ncbi:MAG: sodium:calcium antiporter [Rhodothermales bacterium]|nr:sodium:calcium antiporter [Rhodothermales bacterium]
MLVHLGVLLVGLVVLYFGAEWLIKGASSVAVGFGLRPLIVGLTVVALGTSLPEFMTNFIAALLGKDGLALGNIVGSNIANVGLILGTSAVLAPLAVAPSTLKREYPIMMAVLVLFYVLALDGVVSQVDGGILLVGLAAFLGYLIRDVRRRGVEADAVVASPELEMPGWKKTLLLVLGIVGLALGAHLMVESAVAIAEEFGVDPVIVGLTVVAIGTSLPELAASLVGVFRDETDLSVGNVIGSNLLNVLFVVGTVALVSPLNVASEALALHFPVMIGFGALVMMAWHRERLGRFHGVVLLAAFVGYMTYLVAPLL